MKDTIKRIHTLREQLKKEKVDALLITERHNTRYMSGFTGSSSLIYFTQTRQVLITDFRYMEQATQQCPGWEIVDQGDLGLLKTAMTMAKNDGVVHIGFESAHTNYDTYLQLKAFGIELVPVKDWIETLRQVKSRDEIDKLAQAEAIGDRAFTHIVAFITAHYKEGLTEKKIALELERFMGEAGASGTSFNPIVATGKKSSLCHATPGNACLEKGDFVVLDFGCIYEGYCSDMTRTLVIGEASEKHIEIYNTVRHAQEEALKAIRAGVKGKDIDGIARQIIADAGYGAYFGHGLGHSVGLAIHEAPNFSSKEERVIEEGMVLTVEPGIYVPGFGGVRIEDMVVVTKEGIENLTHSPKDLIVIP